MAPPDQRSATRTLVKMEVGCVNFPRTGNHATLCQLFYHPFTQDGGQTTTLLRQLPRTVEQFCLVVIDDDRIFVAGGLGAAYEAYVYTKSTDAWTSVA